MVLNVTWLKQSNSAKLIMCSSKSCRIRLRVSVVLCNFVEFSQSIHNTCTILSHHSPSNNPIFDHQPFGHWPRNLRHVVSVVLLAHSLTAVSANGKAEELTILTCRWRGWKIVLVRHGVGKKQTVWRDHDDNTKVGGLSNLSVYHQYELSPEYRTPNMIPQASPAN